MIKFIVCEDNELVLKKDIDTINNVMFSNNIEYKIYPFKDYSKELQDIIDINEDNKIYILDIELEDSSGIDIARKIRKNDWSSLIIFSTAHFELFPQVFSDKLMIFDYITKYDDHENNLANTLNKCINIITQNNTIYFKSKSEYYNIKLNSILYIMYDKYNRKTIIKTIDNEYSINNTLISLKDKLNKDFIQINRSTIINKNNVKNLNVKKRYIEFNNGYKLEDILIKKENV